MKESYPTSTTWPYSLSVLLLLALVLAPPTKWVSTFQDVRKDLATWFSPDGPPAHSLAVADRMAERVVVAFDPDSTDPEMPIHMEGATFQVDGTQHTATSSAPMLWEEIPHELTTLPAQPDAEPNLLSSHVRPSNARPSVDDTPEVSEQREAPAPNKPQAGPRENFASSDEEAGSPPADVYVWQPPPNWTPSLIQPLDQFATTTSESAISPIQTENEFATTQTSSPVTSPANANELQAIDIQPPVANRIARLPKVDRDSIQQRLQQVKTQTNPIANDSHSVAIDKPELASEPAESGTQEPSAPPESEIAKQATEPTQEVEQAQPEPVDSNSVARTARVADVWPKSSILNALLFEAKRDVVLTNWATSIEKTLTILEGSRVTGATDQRNALARLRQLSTAEVDRSRWPQAHRELHDRVRLALLRRVDVWQPLMKVAYTEPSSFATYRAQKQLQKTTATLKQTLASDENAAPWIEYLALDTLQTLHSDKMGYRKLADAVLLRMYSSQLTEPQRRFLQGPTFGQFETDLRIVIAKSVHPSDIIHAIEAYESAPSRSTANDLILLMQRWRSAPESKMYRPALDMIVSHYRNANFRVSVSEDLINRFVPAIRQYAERVNDTILGAAVTGQSSTNSNLTVRLIPDDKGIRLGLLAAGTVDSNTASRKGPVTAFSRGQSAFTAGKELRLSPQGMTTSPTETRALAGNEVIGIRTDWDDVPFLGSILRSMARDEIDEQQQQVEAEMEIRVRRQAQQRMDRELDSRVARAGQNLERNVVQPLRRLQLDPRAMDMRTTHDRAIMRTRLAGPWQFAAHTPRPQVRSDSVMSFQIHQSAANNVIEQLQLQNRRMTVEELMATLSERFGMPLQVVDETHKDIVVKFGEHPLEFDFNDGQIQVTIHFEELKRRSRSWKNFSIRGIYRADVEKLDIALEREESVSLIGERIGLRDQLALRGIASKVFGKHQRLQILGDVIQQQSQLRNLSITQFTIRDGWLAVALGEKNGQVRLADRSVGTR